MTMSTFFGVNIKENVKIVKFTTKEITLSNSSDLKDDLDVLFKKEKENNYNYILDLENSAIVTSLFIAILISFIKKVAQKSGSVKMCSLQKMAKDVLSVSKMVNIFEIYETPEDALNSF